MPEKAIQLKIISDGTAGGTRVVDADTGRIISRVISATWTADLRENTISRATLELINIPVELVASERTEVEEAKDNRIPDDKRFKKID